MPQTMPLPTLSAVNVIPPATATGTRLELLVPSPRGPDPQQYAAPPVVRPHVVPDRPPVRATNVSPPLTGVGTAPELVDPLPSCPLSPVPQQYAAPVVVRPQVCWKPALM